MKQTFRQLIANYLAEFDEESALSEEDCIELMSRVRDATIDEVLDNIALSIEDENGRIIEGYDSLSCISDENFDLIKKGDFIIVKVGDVKLKNYEINVTSNT